MEKAHGKIDVTLWGTWYVTNLPAIKRESRSSIKEDSASIFDGRIIIDKFAQSGRPANQHSPLPTAR